MLEDKITYNQPFSSNGTLALYIVLLLMPIFCGASGWGVQGLCCDSPSGLGVLEACFDSPNRLGVQGLCSDTPNEISPSWRAPMSLPERATLIFGGDLMQHTPQIRAARQDDGTYDYRATFEEIAAILNGADLVVVNLETTLTRTNRYSGYPMFRSPIELADAMHEAGVDVALLANNHALDGGQAGVLTTFEELKRVGIASTGVFSDSAQFIARHPLYVSRNNIDFAILNYTYSTNGITARRPIVVNSLDTAAMLRDVALARRKGVDCIVACLHWGEEYARRESAEQRKTAQMLHSAGVDLVVGSHPHVVQRWECTGERVTLFSLGNMVSNQRKRYRDGGILARVEVVKHSVDEVRYSLEIVPIWVELPEYRILPPAAFDGVADEELPREYKIFINDLMQLSEW